MKQFLFAITLACFFMACNNSVETKTQPKNLPIPNEMLTLKLQQKLADQYDNVWDVAEGMAAVKKGDKWGFVNTSGKLVIPIQFDDPNTFNKGYTQVSKGGKAGIIDKTGKVLVPFQYDYIGSYNDGLFSTRDMRNKYGFIDSTGKVVIPFEYDEVNISWFSGGLAIVQKNSKWGAIDKTNKAVIPFVWEELSINDGFDKGFVIAKKKGKPVLVDKTGKEINLPAIDTYKTITPVDNNRLIVEDNAGKVGMIDITGKVIVPLNYKYMSDFNFGYAVVEGDSGRFLLDEKGKTYFEKSPYLNLNVLTSQLFYGNTATDDNMYLFDINGKKIIEQGFGNIIPLADDLLLVNKDGVAWYINYKGEKIADLPN